MIEENSPPLNYAPASLKTPQLEKPYPNERKRVISHGKQILGLVLFMSCVSHFTHSSPGQSRPTQFPELLTSLLFTIPFIIWAIGALRLRRWVRPIALVFAGLMLPFAVAMSVAQIFLLHDIVFGTKNQAPVPGAFLTVFAILIALMCVLVIALPILGIRFYKNPAVKTMLEYYDPQPRWTDHFPIPVLAVYVILIFITVVTAVTLPESAQLAYDAKTSVPLAIATNLFQMAVALTLAMLIYRLRAIGWWGLLISILAIAFTLHPGFDTLFFIAPLGYLIYIRRYFTPPSQSTPPNFKTAP